MIYFIRHAQSSFNFADQQYKQQKGDQFEKTSEEYLDLKFHPQFVDCSLTEKDKQQCQNARKELEDVEINLVLVSPMRRTLETCDLIFRNHKSKPKIIVDPSVREVFSSSCDIGTRLRQAHEDFPYLDFSEIKNIDYWYIDSIKNQEVRQILMDALQKQMKQEQINNLQSKQHQQKLNKLSFEIMLNYLKEAYGKIDLFSLSDFKTQKQRIKKLAKEYGSISVVSHHENILTYTKQSPKNAKVLKVSVDDI